MLAEAVLSATSLLLFCKTRLWSFLGLSAAFLLAMAWRPLYPLLAPALLALVLETLKRLKKT